MWPQWVGRLALVNSCASCCAGAEDVKVNGKPLAPGNSVPHGGETKGGGEDGEVGKHRKAAGEERTFVGS